MYELRGSKLENPFSFPENTDDVKMQMGRKKGNLRKERKWGSTVWRNLFENDIQLNVRDKNFLPEISIMTAQRNLCQNSCK